ncbi:ABC transporter permease [Nocardia stercoris]|uniref:ABC transporter permease n=1 Tax=Nocardia stercoris TaxID=2483361 RepID=A0A3M2L3A3_9NOCA|nr:ABC transporter permease [Nocardia stercoris]RMI31170.1 ABC transporter permease [Nocardia stercoris]
MTARAAAAVALAVLVVAVLAAVAPSVLAGSPDRIDPGAALHGPSAVHVFGTDWLGRDVYARVVYGTRASLLVGVGGTVLATLVGTGWGLVAALGGRVTDQLAMRTADVLLSFPTLLLALLMVAALGPGRWNMTIAVTVALAPGFARLVRIRAHLVRRFAYVRAATDLGRPTWQVALVHIVPNVLLPLMGVVVPNIGVAIIVGASLSFLGLGPDSATPEWGSMLAQSRDYLSVAWAPAVFPALAVTATVLSISVAGRALGTRVDDGRSR